MLDDLSKRIVKTLDKLLTPDPKEGNLSEVDRKLIQYHKAEVLNSYGKSKRDEIKAEALKHKEFDQKTREKGIAGVIKTGVKCNVEVLTGDSFCLEVEIQKGRKSLDGEQVLAYLKRKGWSDAQLEALITQCTKTTKPVESFRIVELSTTET
jgi:hypothetical protein